MGQPFQNKQFQILKRQGQTTCCCNHKGRWVAGGHLTLKGQMGKTAENVSVGLLQSKQK